MSDRKVRKKIDTPFVNNLAVFPLEERAHLGLSREDRRDELACDFLLQFVLMSYVPLLEPQFSLPRKQKHKLHLEEREMTPVNSLISFDLCFTTGGCSRLIIIHRWMLKKNY